MQPDKCVLKWGSYPPSVSDFRFALIISFWFFLDLFHFFFSGNFKVMVRLICYLKMHQLPRELYSDFMTFFNVFGLVYVAGNSYPGNGAKWEREAPHLHPTHYSASLSLSLKHKKLDWFSIFIPRERWERKKTWESPGPRIEREREYVTKEQILKYESRLWPFSIIRLDVKPKRE